ncbi:MAG: type II toxin-antitoxin system RelE family toxin [Terriglobia bacterium]
MTAPQSPYEVKFTDDAMTDVQSLDGSIKKRLRKVLDEKIAFEPEQFGTPLRASLSGYWKHEFASHRVIYRIYPERKLVVVCAVGARKGLHKTDVYRQIEFVAKTGRLAEQILAVIKSLQSR